VRDGRNGRLLPAEDLEAFVAALEWTASLSREDRRRVRAAARRTARAGSLPRCTQRLEQLYESLCGRAPAAGHVDDSPWDVARRRIEREWAIWKNIAGAATEALLGEGRATNAGPER
jgi:hypothetical protein